MKSTFNIHGRFGNNLFQYFASKIITKIYQDIIPIGNDVFVIDDPIYKELCEYYILNNKPKEIKNCRMIVLDGYFQYGDILNYFYDYISSLITEDNDEYISTGIKVKDLLQTVPVNKNDLVIHVRLDDYMHERSNCEIVHYDYYTSVIENTKYDNLIIVCDRIIKDYEIEYMSNFDIYNPVYHQKSLLEDFIFLKSANRIISSNSTLSWLAAFLSNAQEIHVPKSNYHVNQRLWNIRDTSILHTIKFLI